MLMAVASNMLKLRKCGALTSSMAAGKLPADLPLPRRQFMALLAFGLTFTSKLQAY
jgi:hypothetical protein